MKRAAFALALLALVSVLPAAAATTYSVDVAHSDVGFTIRHFVSQVRGRFDQFSGTIVRDEADPGKSTVEFRIQATSINTNQPDRDKDLRSPNFFDVATHPEIVFKSRSVEAVTADEYRVTGDLTMRGITKVVTLPVRFEGEMKDAWGGVRAGFSTAITLDRKEFGINWNKVLDSGGVMLGDEVGVSISLETKRQG
jgi:polyisoprenoid-binding protein YceI